uniref:Uncharacterized protein n=1 Tax=Lepeophtheirus salmonis TaxID=72036 RepID=A0A0K2TFN9_LEPSM
MNKEPTVDSQIATKRSLKSNTTILELHQLGINTHYSAPLIIRNIFKSIYISYVIT